MGALLATTILVLQAVPDSFRAQHGDALPALDPHTKSTIRKNVRKVFNREQRRATKHTPFSIPEIQHALDRLKKEVVPGVDRLPVEAYERLTLPVKRRLATRLWDIVTGATFIPPEWADLVHPSYKKRDWAQPGNWRPIVCATTGVDANTGSHHASSLCPHSRQHVWGHGKQVPPRGHPPPGHRAGHELLRDDPRLP